MFLQVAMPKISAGKSIKRDVNARDYVAETLALPLKGPAPGETHPAMITVFSVPDGFCPPVICTQTRLEFT
jgi:hypothetical protein